MSIPATISATVQRVLRRARATPPIAGLRRARARAEFLSPAGFARCWGVFDDFAAARAAGPPSTEFDTSTLVDAYVRDRTAHVFAYDYPVMWWLRAAFAGGATSVFDLGGSVGVHYYAYRPHLAYPATLAWTVREVPTLVRHGRALAVQRGAPGLTFTETLEATDAAADVWLSAGALQYVEGAASLGAWLAASRRPPAHVIINKVPLYDGPGFVTLQNIGDGAFAPLHVYQRRRFLEEVEAAGYRVVETWDTPERQLRLDDDPARSFGAYSGVYVARAGGG
ncbi:MAG: methyltransferase, TIGR04325 family [Kofleriaceae bacterium]